MKIFRGNLHIAEFGDTVFCHLLGHLKVFACISAHMPHENRHQSAVTTIYSDTPQFNSTTSTNRADFFSGASYEAERLSQPRTSGCLHWGHLRKINLHILIPNQTVGTDQWYATDEGKGRLPRTIPQSVFAQNRSGMYSSIILHVVFSTSGQ